MSYSCWLRISKCSFLSVVQRNCCFRGRKKSDRQGIQRKVMFALPIHFVAFDGGWWIWESDSILSGCHTGESVLALQVKMWKRERVFEDEVFMENTCFGIGSKKHGTNSNKDVVLSTDPVVLLANGSGTSGIPSILNYWSVSPIVSSFKEYHSSGVTNTQDILLEDQPWYYFSHKWTYTVYLSFPGERERSSSSGVRIQLKGPCTTLTTTPRWRIVYLHIILTAFTSDVNC